MPELFQCPKCGRKSVFWNSFSERYECLNNNCKEVFTRTEFAEFKTNIEPEKADSGSDVKQCPLCNMKSLYYNGYSQKYECLNPECHVTLVQAGMEVKPAGQSENQSAEVEHDLQKMKNWIKTLAVSLLLTGILLGAGWYFTYNVLSSAVGQKTEALNAATLQLTQKTQALDSTTSQLTQKTQALDSATLQLTQKDQALKATQSTLDSTKTQLTLYQSTYGSVVASGVIPPFQDANIISQLTSIDPTWVQLQNFLLADKTDQNTYIPDAYTCGEYARDVHNNAERSGIRAAYVAIEFPDVWHACNAFKTTDRGLIFIDCGGKRAKEQGPSNCDKTVVVKLGKDYKPMSLIPQSGWEVAWGNMGRILDVQVYW